MLKRLTLHFWIINLATLASVAFFLASGASEFAAAKLETLLPETDTLPIKAESAADENEEDFSRPRKGDAILSRNIFDSETGPIIRPVPKTPDGGHGDTILADELPLLPCANREIKLAVNVATPNDSAWSLASVEIGRSAQLYRIGDELDGRTVTGITWRYMFLRGSQGECYVDLFADPR